MTVADLTRLATPALMAMAISNGQWLPAPHLMAIDREVTRALAGFGPRIIVIEAPPRHGKSEYVSRYLPVWQAAVRPDSRTILTSYEAGFARTWGHKARNLIQEHGQTLGIRVDKFKRAAADWGITGHNGGMTTAGVGGAITGRGADLLIVDDSIKNAEEALSPTVRNSIKEWWQSTAWTRVEPGGLAILMQTRWHAEDLSGIVLASAESGEGPPVNRIRLPAIAEDHDWLGRAPGEALWPERFPLDVLQEKRRGMDTYWWESLYQQAPGRHGSTEWPDDYWGEHLWVSELPAKFDFGAIAVDPSKGRFGHRGDYSAIVFVGVADGRLWVDSSVARRPTEQIVSDGIDLALKYGASLNAFGIEINQFQELLVGEYERQVEERRLIPLPIHTIDNRVNKKLRISRLGPYFARRKVRLLDSPDNRLLVQQCRQFSMKEIHGVHDDGPDAMEMAIRVLVELQGGQIRDDGLGTSLVEMVG